MTDHRSNAAITSWNAKILDRWERANVVLQWGKLKTNEKKKTNKTKKNKHKQYKENSKTNNTKEGKNEHMKESKLFHLLPPTAQFQHGTLIPSKHPKIRSMPTALRTMCARELSRRWKNKVRRLFSFSFSFFAYILAKFFGQINKRTRFNLPAILTVSLAVLRSTANMLMR